MRNTGRQAAGAADADLDAGDDAALIARSLHAPECFGVLFDRHAPAIGRYIARRLGPDAADDLVAETFLAAFRRRDHYDLTQGDARPWLYGIATRLIGRHRRQEVRFFRAIARTGVDPAAEPVTDQVIDRIAAQGARRELAAALARLSQDQRDVLPLVASGLGYEETALALAVPAGTVSSRLVRARRKVREALGGQDPTRPDPTGRGCTVIDEMEQLKQLCAAVPSPDRQRLTAARAQLSTAIRRETAGHAARRPRLAVSLTLHHRWLSRRWLGWAAPLAAAAAVTGVILGSQGAFSPVHRPVPSSSTHDPGLGLPHRATAYVAGQSGTVTPILPATGTALKPIRIGKEHGQISSAIVFRPDGKTAYVLSSTVLGGGSGTVTPIRTATNTALKPITVGQDPRALAITPDGTTIYVTNYQSGTVTPIRTATNTALAPIRVGRNPLAIAIAPDGKTAYVLNNGSGTVTPIRTATSTALAPIRVPAGSFSMAITPDGKTIYVLDLGSSRAQEGMVIPIRTATNTALRPIPIGHAWPSTMNIAITPDSKIAYVANASTGTVTPIRTATDTALTRIRLAGGAGPIAINPDGRTAYVIAGSGPGRTGTVIPIRTATNQVLRAITVSNLPSVIAITPAPRR